jgi:hypothetical protein
VKLVVGCPVSCREWILPTWFGYVERACETAGLDEPGYVFVVHPQDKSWDCILDHCSSATLVPAPFHRGRDTRDWLPPRYQQMVTLRNLLLDTVRAEQPDLFLSLDSDILLHADQLKFMIEALERFDAVGGRCYMTSAGTRFPSWGKLTRTGGLQRVDGDGTFAVDVIMAIKLMSPSAYAVDYVFDLQGEDIGWSKACREHGLTLGWDGRVIAKHVLAPHLLTARDPRVGF